MSHALLRNTCFAALLIAASVAAGGAALAQDLWEFSPYRVTVWLAPGPEAELTPALWDEIARTATWRAETVFGATWHLHVDRVPDEFRTEAALRMESLAIDELIKRAQLTGTRKPRKPPPVAAEQAEGAGISQGEPSNGAAAPAVPKAKASVEVPVDALTQTLRELFQEDKLFVVSVTGESGSWRVRCRELDCRARVWSATHEQRIHDLSLVPQAVWGTIEQTFRAVARLENVKDKEVNWRLRAAGLAIRDDCPALAGDGSIWRPYIRINDRFGEPRQGVVPALPWSFALGKERIGTLLKSEYVTGVKNPLAGRMTSRTQRFALRVRPTGTTTIIKLRSSDKNAETLSGYDILAKSPDSEDSETLGRTDWRGAMEIPANDHPVRILYVRNGGALLARLPMVPGLEPVATVEMTSDDRRLFAEGYVTGMQGQIMDLVARRAIVSNRIKRRVNEGKGDEAARILDEFKAMPSKEDLIRQIDQAQVRLTSPNKRVQEKIDKMFNDTRKLLDKFVDAKLLRELEAEVGQTGAISTALGTDSASTPAAKPSGDGRATAKPEAPTPPAGTPPP